VRGEDLHAVVEGVERVRGMARKIPGIVEPEDTPGADCDGADRLKEFIRRHAWGHHASCTCPIGPKDAGGVLMSDLRVHGVYDLRIVDASVFPRIPGFFIVCAIYMVAEKVAEVTRISIL
jgi:choline dehydrogenase-like flavoprotein